MGGRIPSKLKKGSCGNGYWVRNGIKLQETLILETVSEIINQYSLKDSEVGLIRLVALAIKDPQTDVLTFSQAMRLKIF